MRVQRVQEFAIGVFHGDAPWSVSDPAGLRNPVLTRNNVRDVPAAFVADPFAMRRDGTWFMFFEVMRADTARGEIAVATSHDGWAWSYQRVVLAEPFHLSYPYVFEWEGDAYMIPETGEANEVRLYRARSFPFEWEFVAPLLAGERFLDASIFRHQGRWWLFTEASQRPAGADAAVPHGTLRLYGAPELTGPWSEHPKSPVISDDATIARPAGRVVSVDQKVIRFAQDCSGAYGLSVRAFEIMELTPDAYREVPLGSAAMLGPGRRSWNKGGMHHVDAHPVDSGWLAFVDGWTLRFVLWRRSA